MNDAEKEGRALELAIAGRIRKKRLDLEWTLEYLSKVTGLSKGYLSQIENGEKTPLISTLTKIAFGLGENTTSLITGQTTKKKQAKFVLTRAKNRCPIAHTEAAVGSVYESFDFNRPDRFMDSYIVTVSHEFPPKPMLHNGQEFALVLSGKQEFYYDGKIIPIEKGDAIYFDSDRPHMSRSVGKNLSVVVVVLCNLVGNP